MSRFGLFLCKKAGKYNKPRKSYSKYRLWRRAAAVMMILSLTAGLAACGGSAGEGSQAAAKDAGVQRYAWPLGSSSPEDTVTQIYAEKFADEVDRLSDGKMKISVYPNSVLGGRQRASRVMQGWRYTFCSAEHCAAGNFHEGYCSI